MVRRLLVLGAAASLLGGCQPTARPDAARAGSAVTAGSGVNASIYHSMKHVIAPQAQIMWDVSNAAVDDNGSPDATKLTAADWAKAAAAGAAMGGEATRLAGASALRVVAPGEAIDSEGKPGGTSAAQVQAFVDADRQRFAELSRALASVAGAFASAAQARSAARLGEAAGKLDTACEACHARFWYPEQQAPGQ